jgi:hypothetical protein
MTETVAGETEQDTAFRDHTLYAVYDLGFSPITFDFLQFLQLADMERRRRRFTRVSFVFVLATKRRFREQTPKDLAVQVHDKHWRLRHIQMEACWLLPACSGVQAFLDRAEAQRLLANVSDAQIFPVDYKLTEPRVGFLVAHVVQTHDATGLSPLVFQATQAGLDAVDRWLEAEGITKPIVAMTLRNSGYESNRNANADDWMRFAHYLAAEGYQPVFVPDTDEAFTATRQDYQTDFPTYWPAPVNLELRAALYRRARLCMSDNGAAAFIHHWMPDCPSIVFQPPSKIPNVFRKTKEGQAGIERVFGIKVGEQLPYCAPFQRLAWCDDVYENLVEEFRRVERLIGTIEVDTASVKVTEAEPE